jgi:hypothetical protein
MVLVSKQRGEAGGGVEARQAKPVDAAVTADERAGLHVADKPIVLDAHGSISFAAGENSASTARRSTASPDQGEGTD